MRRRPPGFRESRTVSICRLSWKLPRKAMPAIRWVSRSTLLKAA